MVETKVILVTLLPTEPRDPQAFHDDIANLKIEAFDLTVKNSKNGERIGSAEKVTPAPYYLPIEIEQPDPQQPPKLKTAIFQHFKLTAKSQPPPPPLSPYDVEAKSVATAAIVVKLPSDHSEFDSLDLRLVVTRGTDKINKLPSLEFNAPVRTLTDPLPTDPYVWIGLDYANGVNFLDPSSKAEPIWRAAYVFIPPVPSVTSSRSGLSISGDGVTPSFDDLLEAVNKVLEDDHSSTDPATRRSLQERDKPLDPAQSLQVARELVYDRATFPLPAPKQKTLEDMYGKPDIASQDDQERKQFEANLTAYHAQHDAEALQMATFVFAISAAVECEKRSLLASSAGFTFDVIADPTQPKLPFSTKSVLLQGTGDVPAALNPTFGVPAAFYFALGANLPTDVNADDRQATASITSESAILKTLQAARDNGIIKDKESAVTNTTDELLKGLVVEQAARRLSALGATKGNQITVVLDASTVVLVNDWLKFSGDSSTISEFWISESTSHPGEYFDLLLDVIVDEQHALKDEIVSALGVHSSQALASITDQRWRSFWLSDPQSRLSLLPNYTLPGSPNQRVEAFIKYINSLFSVRVEVVSRNDQAGDVVKILSRPRQDILQMFLDALPGFSFAIDLDDNAISSALNGLPVDERTKEWAKKAIHCTSFLYNVTKTSNPNTHDGPFQFSLMESLYARGFINADRIALLTKTQFRAALAGTIAYRTTASGDPLSNLIYDLALQMPHTTPSIGPEPNFSFSPVNPGQLVDCIPPDHLSPFGLNMYLRLLLSSAVILNGSDVVLRDVILTRCGRLSDLEVTTANLEIALPLIDIANESLEALVEQVSTNSERKGVVYNVDENEIGSYKFGGEDNGLDPAQALLAIPQHSTPQLINITTTAYQVLKSDFSFPCLPYHQELDINRSYLASLGMTRFDTMRTFRKDITEFVLSPSPEPPDFQSSLWRYPVRLDIASEYLNISEHERQLLFSTYEGIVGALYGFSATQDEWTSTLSSLPIFLERTGLSYCEFYTLWETDFFPISRISPRQESATAEPEASELEAGSSETRVDEVSESDTGEADASSVFPECEPCCLKSFGISFGENGQYETVLYRIAVFIRLWRKVESRYGTGNLSIAVLADICRVIKPFPEHGNTVDSNFIRQLVALFMLCGEYRLPLCEQKPPLCLDTDKVLKPHDRVPILALWSESSLESLAAKCAIRMLLLGIEGPEFSKILEEDLRALAKISGFTRDVPWHAKPTCTLRFAEILAKIYASPFTVGEILFLFTARRHRLGDDPYPYTEEDESKDDPLNVPEDDEVHGLWELRRKLLSVDLDDQDIKCWSWHRIEHSLRTDFGVPTSQCRSDDVLVILAEHFFPHVFQARSCPCSVPPERRRFHTNLRPEDTTAEMWDSPPCKPFHYSAPDLWIELPLRDEDVLRKLALMRQLSGQRNNGRQSEIDAIRQLYFAPRAMLAPFTAIFGSLAEAIDAMVQEPCEEKRFAYFQRSFATFHKRCEILTEHLSSHIHQTLACQGFPEPRDHHIAWKILKHLIADENNPQGESWEKDSGASPEAAAFPWEPNFTGSAFAALLGLIGTGLEGKFTTVDNEPAWKEIRGPLTAFGVIPNKRNAPVPTVIPSLDLAPTADQRLTVLVRNGLAIDGATAKQLGGAQPFRVEWKGVLLVDCTGQYRFSIHRPCVTHGIDCKHDGDCCDEGRWSVRLRRGKKWWVLISHGLDHHEHAHPWHSRPVCLSHGTYDIDVCLEQPQPDFKEDEPTDLPYTGFAVRYCGPDTNDETLDIPLDKLFIKTKRGHLTIPESGLIPEGEQDKRPNMLAFLDKQYVSSLRDIRRTYQRAFKALLFTKRFCLSADELDCCHGRSELGFILSRPKNFQGTAYYPVKNESQRTEQSNASVTSSVEYKPHHADFNFNFLPVKDAYYPPSRDEDNRAEPSLRRSTALFDWWERIFDYRRLACGVEELEPCRGPVWQLFYEAATQQPRDATTLVRLLGVDIKIVPLVLSYFEGYRVSVADLMDERWTIRVWHAWQAVQRMEQALYSKSIHHARPDLWAATSPGSAVDAQSPTPQQTGNQNLVDFVVKSLLFDHDEPQYCAVRKLNDGLRVRANKALVAYLTVLERIPLAFQHTPGEGGTILTAKSAADLSAFLLQDASPSLCQLSTRTSHAVSCIQTLIQRIQIGLEPTVQLTSLLEENWDHTLGSFETFEKYVRRIFYSENWVQWEELRIARNSEAFHFFESGLKTHTLSIPKSSPPFPMAGNVNIPSTRGLIALQAAENAKLSQGSMSLDEGVSIVGTPMRSAQPSWLSPGVFEESTPGNDNGDVRPRRLALPTPDNQVKLPMWFQAAVRLGTTFIRVAAAGSPPAITHSWDEDELPVKSSCHCGKEHAPVMDEYYFWLEKGEYFNADNAPQDANIGVRPPDPTSDWERDASLPKMLHWPTQPLVYLHWTRIHCGEMSPPRRSSDGAPYNPSTEKPEFSFNGRKQDSLLFGVFGSSTRGFRYDMAPDTAVAHPQITEDAPSDEPVPAPFSTYPFFVYFEPGAPIAPVSTFGTALAIAGSLRTQCKFEEALKWCRAALDPLQRENKWAQCRPEQAAQTEPQSVRERLLLIDFPKTSSRGQTSDGPCCPTSPVQVGIARARAVLLEYLSILLQWGDSLLCRGTFESRKQASILFDEAIRLLGPKPSIIKAKSAPFKAGSERVRTTVDNFFPSAAPLNPKLIELYERAYDGKDLLSRCSNAQRLSIRPETSIVRANMRGGHQAESTELCDCGISQGQCCLLPYKFSFLLPKAQELVSVVKGLGGALLSAIEKGDSEYLASIRQAQEHQMNDLVLSSRQNSYRESDWQVQALDQQLQGALTRLRYYQQLIKNDLNQNEHSFLAATKLAMQLRVAGNVSEGVGQGMNFIPDITVGGAGVGGSPVAINELPIGTKLAQVFQAASRILNVLGDVQNTTSNIGSTRGSWDRRAEEWQHQVNVTTIEIAQIKRQQLAAQRRRDVSLKELNNHRVQMENSAEVDAFLRDKMSKHDLYLFMQQQTAQLHRRTFDLAWETVRDAQAALSHERPDLRDRIVSAIPPELGPAGWDNLHSGLLAGERLELALHSLDRMYMRSASCREYELSKHISLRLHLPLAFLQLKTLGWCKFELPEWLFDMDYPGHYLRRIKNVSVTIPCVVGPYVGVHCRLQLLSSGIRLSPTLPSSTKCCCKPGPSCIGPLPKPLCNGNPAPLNSWGCPTQQQTPICTSSYTSPASLHRSHLTTEAIATSTGQNDAGVFDLSFRDDKTRAPFEFAGAVASRWRVELPPRNNAFDLEESLTDFVLHVNYTAREGGAALRDVAERAVGRRVPGDGVRFFDVKNEWSGAWAAAFGRLEMQMHKSKQGGKHKEDGKAKGKHYHSTIRTLPLSFSRRAFPFLPSTHSHPYTKRNIIITSLSLFIDTYSSSSSPSSPSRPPTHFTITFKPTHGCKDDWKSIHCTAQCATPGFFHGALEGVRLGPIGEEGSGQVGVLEFPGEIVVGGEKGGGVKGVWVLVGWEAEG